MTNELDLLEGRNEAQRWQAIVSQFNAALAIQQDLQRSLYEEKFDQIRRDNERVINEIKLERASLDNKLCEALDTIDDLNDELSIMEDNKIKLSGDLDMLRVEEDQLNRLSVQLQQKARLAAERSEKSEIETVEELERLDHEKQQLRDEIRDLKGFINMQTRLADAAPDTQGQSFITAPKVKDRKKNKHFYVTLALNGIISFFPRDK